MSRKSLFIAACLLAIPLAEAKIAKELKDQVFAKYDKKNLTVVKPNILVAPVKIQLGDVTYPVNYDYFHSGISTSKAYQRRNRLDEKTTEEVTGEAKLTDALMPGETLRVHRLLLNEPPFTSQRKEFGNDAVLVDFYLEALSGKRVSRETTESNAGFIYNDKTPFGVHFRFVIPAPESQSADAIAKIIDQYFMPAGEYTQTQRSNEAAAAARQNVTIQPGMSKDEVLRILGEPVRSVVFGNKITLRYADLTVELQEGKVVDVKTN